MARIPSKSGEPKPYALYWCTTADGDEDWFVVALSPREACRFHELEEGYARGAASAERVVSLPPALITARGWKDGPDGRAHRRAGWPSEALLASCGAEVAEIAPGRDLLREMVRVLNKDVRIGGRVFRAGDVVTNLERQDGVKKARLSAFPGGKEASRKPSWWTWELELTPHLEKRMEDRRFTEVELREMLEKATTWSESGVDGRFVIHARLKRQPWAVVVEPDEVEHLWSWSRHTRSSDEAAVP